MKEISVTVKFALAMGDDLQHSQLTEHLHPFLHKSILKFAKNPGIALASPVSINAKENFMIAKTLEK